ncbi:MAG: phosphoadenylyl-sulfate reductase [Candidatus Dormibacteria bacterium]|jgi:thioredoxin-dependent adenylylsulfate APS reductase
MSAALRIPTGDLAAAALELEGADAEAILAWTFERFSRVAIVASFQAESVVLIDMASRLRPGVDVITLDTGRLPQETHELIDTVRSRFPVTLHVVSPDPGELEEMTRAHGVNLFYLSPELRHTCCEVRKTRPLARALAGYDAWVTGLRREQSTTRRATPVVARDEAHGGIAKVAPLAGWSHGDVWARVRSRDLPSHALYARDYTSIGCAPCTRATRPGEDERAGRWWWEGDSIKECGLHPALTGRGAAADVATSPGRADAGAEAIAATAAQPGEEG